MISKIAQENTTAEALIELRTSIVNFHQNIRIAYNKLKDSKQIGAVPAATLDMLIPYLNNIAAAPVFQSTFTTDQVKSHLRYLEGITKKLASVPNAAEQAPMTTKYGKQPYYDELKNLATKIQKMFVPLATGIHFNITDEQLIEQAPVVSNLLDKVGTNFVTLLEKSLAEMKKNASLSPTEILRFAGQLLKLLK